MATLSSAELLAELEQDGRVRRAVLNERRCAVGLPPMEWERQDQREVALKNANETRAARAALKRDVQSGAVSLGDVLLPVHQLVSEMLLVDVVRWQYVDRCRTTALEELGRQAVSDAVNLLVRVGRASERSRCWVAHYGRHRGYKRGV